MKSIFLFIIIFFSLQNSTAQVQNYEEGEVVLDFTVTDIFGEEHNLYTYTAAGKHVFIDCFYKDCGGCQILAPVFNELYDKYGCNEGSVVCLLINRGVDNDADVIEFEEEHGGDFHHAPAISRNGGAIDVNNDFNPYAYPTICIIGPDNTLVENRVYPNSSIEEIEAFFPEDFTPEEMNCTIETSSSIIEPTFNVSPNPLSENTFKITLNNWENASVTVYDLLGNQVYHNSINSNISIHKHNFTSGTYIISVRYKELVHTKKLIVL